jgi:predicted hydrocarbon binding protein
MPSDKDIQPEKAHLFSGPMVPVLHLRLVEALSVEHGGNNAEVENALHTLGRQMTTPILLTLIRSYAQPREAYIPNNADLFLNRIDEYLAKNWELFVGAPPSQLSFVDDTTLRLVASPCPLCQRDVIEAGLKLRYCELIAGALEGLVQSWIDNLALHYVASVSESACRLQGKKACEFRVHFEEKLAKGK